MNNNCTLLETILPPPPPPPPPPQQTTSTSSSYRPFFKSRPMDALLKNHLFHYFPKIELSYENNTHNKVVSSNYDIVLAIPLSKKYIIWFTFLENKDVCFMIELNKEKKGNIYEVDTSFHPSLSLGTILYGSFIKNQIFENDVGDFIIEDIFYFKGINIKNVCYGEKLGFLKDFFDKYISFPLQQTIQSSSFSTSSLNKINITFYLIAIKFILHEYVRPLPIHQQQQVIISDDNIDYLKKACRYNIHHFQFRSLKKILPNLNYFQKNIDPPPPPPPFPSSSTTKIIEIEKKSLRNICDFSKKQYQLKTIFQVKANIQPDIYDLYVIGKNNNIVYFDLALIPDYKTSVLMNTIFRKIKENKNIDYIEESEDEEDFQNVEETKYVDVTKIAYLECFFNNKFKRWVPLQQIQPDPNNEKIIVHYSKLIKFS